MGSGEMNQRKRFEEAAFPHLQELWATALWLTKRRSHADQLTAKTVTQAYREWKIEGDSPDSRAWLYRTLTREFSPFSRQIHPPDRTARKRLTSAGDGGNGDHRDPVTSVDRPGQLLLTGVSDIAVKGAVARLRPLSRLIMILHWREHFSYSEIAYITDLSVSSIKAILNRVRRMIPQYLLQHADKFATEPIRDTANSGHQVRFEGSPAPAAPPLGDLSLSKDSQQYMRNNDAGNIG